MFLAALIASRSVLVAVSLGPFVRAVARLRFLFFLDWRIRRLPTFLYFLFPHCSKPLNRLFDRIRLTEFRVLRRGNRHSRAFGQSRLFLDRGWNDILAFSSVRHFQAPSLMFPVPLYAYPAPSLALYSSDLVAGLRASRYDRYRTQDQKKCAADLVLTLGFTIFSMSHAALLPFHTFPFF